MNRDPGQNRRPYGDQAAEWLTLGQAAKYLGVAQSTIRKWSDLGRVPAFYTPGGHRRYRRGDLDAFLESSGPGGAEQAGPLVLIVDDDEHMREYVKVNLELEGYSVRAVGSAEEGLDAVEEQAPALSERILDVRRIAAKVSALKQLILFHIAQSTHQSTAANRKKSGV